MTLEALQYQTGFANEFATEALPGALPEGRNSPQRAPYGLYAEQLSGTAFTAPRHANRRSWLYRIRPAAVHLPFERIDDGRTRSRFDEVPTPPNQLRWDPLPSPTEPTDFVDGLVTMAGNASCGIHLYAANRSMERRFFYNADGELLIVPQQGRLVLATELGVLEVEPHEIAVVPRGVRFQVRLPDADQGAARGYVCENYGALFKLPDLGVIGSNGLANPRDFRTPVAAFEDREGEFQLVAKFHGHLWRAGIGHSPLDVVAWHGNYAPYKYDLRRFNTIGSISCDHPDPSIFLVLQAPSDTPGVDSIDFYTSVHHANNIGRQFRPDNPMLPNCKWVPIGYHGRASSIGVSGQCFQRPIGQTLTAGAQQPEVGPCKRLDYELEIGIFIGRGNAAGEPIPMADAESHVFGVCLLNDWSARDIQAWEYQPLGPFLSKNFATTVSPWIVTLDALAPFRVPFERPPNDPQPLPYLDSPANRALGAIDLQLDVLLQTRQMSEQGRPAVRLTRTSCRHAYWTIGQMVAHHTINGCDLQPGDLFGSGTLSGPTLDQAGALIELTVGGKQPLELPNGQTRTYLEDFDTVILEGWCEKPGATRIGFGECRGTVLPART